MKPKLPKKLFLIKVEKGVENPYWEVAENVEAFEDHADGNFVYEMDVSTFKLLGKKKTRIEFDSV